ncbi:DUF6000 family protein [Actinopolymorpha alba]|uniref:DUF6000 family protein n=1 Tax=Actinopolymorpha alba TaxID=533267 RepID=UPI0003640C4A|nr:DUF6000 family protein [Actinopolymorpha alba]
MDTRSPHDPEVVDAIRRYVIWAIDQPGKPRYLQLLNGNFLRDSEPDRSAFGAALAEDARQIGDDDLKKLLTTEWRARLTAAWLIGLDRRVRFRALLGGLLLESRFVYAGQGYCFALARFEQPEGADILAAHLERYLPRADCYFDQDWAIGALLYLDQRLNTNRADQFLSPGGPWHRSAFAEVDPAECHRKTTAFCNFADQLTRTDG